MPAWLANGKASPKPKIRNDSKLRTKYLKKNGSWQNR
jgi:hypothetical protein